MIVAVAAVVEVAVPSHNVIDTGIPVSAALVPTCAHVQDPPDTPVAASVAEAVEMSSSTALPTVVGVTVTEV